jgi:putative transposase
VDETDRQKRDLETWGVLENCNCLLHDRDGKFCPSFDRIIESGKAKPILLPARSPNLNSYAERWVRSLKEDCLSKLILFGESSLKRALQQYKVHYHEERNHQGKENQLLFPRQTQPATRSQGQVHCQERLGGLLNYYYREAA